MLDSLIVGRRGRGLRQAAVEKILDWTDGLGTAEAVAGAFHGHEGDIDTVLLQRGAEQLALVEWDGAVVVTVHDKEGRAIFRDVGNGAGSGGFGFVFGDGAADEMTLRRVGGIMRNIAFKIANLQKVGGSEPVDDGLDAAGVVEIVISTFEFSDAAGGAEEGGEVSAGGGAPGNETICGQTVLRGMSAQPSDSGLAVVDLRGEFGVLGETIVNVGDGKTVGSEGKCRAGAVFAAGHPGAAMNPNDEGQGAVAFFGQVEVQQQRFVIGSAIFEITQGGNTRQQTKVSRGLVGGGLSGSGGGEQEWDDGAKDFHRDSMAKRGDRKKGEVRGLRGVEKGKEVEITIKTKSGRKIERKIKNEEETVGVGMRGTERITGRAIRQRGAGGSCGFDQLRIQTGAQVRYRGVGVRGRRRGRDGNWERLRLELCQTSSVLRRSMREFWCCG
jgi:hypothetical protein